MPAKKIKESRTNYATTKTASKGVKGKRSNSGARGTSMPRAASRRISIADEGHAEINQNLRELKTGLIDIQQRLSALEEHLSSLNAAQKRFETISASLSDEMGWLKLSESAFAFWDNAEDDVYDTL